MPYRLLYQGILGDRYLRQVVIERFDLRQLLRKGHGPQLLAIRATDRPEQTIVGTEESDHASGSAIVHHRRPGVQDIAMN
ncbi:hypothetical protein D3C78_1547240 [compost metagenome]